MNRHSAESPPGKRERILEAAVRIFAEKGFYNAKVSEIARVAGVADGTIYLYFKSKDDLLISIFEDRMEEVNANARAAVAGPGAPLDKLDALLRTHLALVQANPLLAEVLTVELRQSTKFLKEYRQSKFGEFLKLVAQPIEEGQRDGTIRADVEAPVVARALFGALDELVLAWLLRRGRRRGAAGAGGAPSIRGRWRSSWARCSSTACVLRPAAPRRSLQAHRNIPRPPVHPPAKGEHREDPRHAQAGPRPRAEDQVQGRPARAVHRLLGHQLGAQPVRRVRRRDRPATDREWLRGQRARRRGGGGLHRAQGRDAAAALGPGHGRERAILVDGSDDNLDAEVVARHVVALVAQEKPDLVLMGKLAADSEDNQAGQLVAAYLGWPQATNAASIEVCDGGKALLVGREADAGTEMKKVNLPAVVTVDLRIILSKAVKNGVTAADFAYPEGQRYASLKGIMAAKKKPIVETTAAALGVGAALRVKTTAVEAPPARKAGIKVGSVEELVGKLHNEAKVI